MRGWDAPPFSSTSVLERGRKRNVFASRLEKLPEKFCKVPVKKTWVVDNKMTKPIHTNTPGTPPIPRNTEKRLDVLMHGIPICRSIGDTDIEVTGVQSYSPNIRRDNLFVAVKLIKDGHDHIADAIAKGAMAIVCQELPRTLVERITYIEVEDSKKALGKIASRFYGNPSERLQLVGVTGTNGKTSTATLLYDLFARLGHKVGLLSTVENRIAGRVEKAAITTPTAVPLNRRLAEMLAQGCTHCFMEVSSESIDQKRIAGVTFSGIIFTNISHDHLDYHKTFQAYWQTKKKLFDDLPDSTWVLLNKDEEKSADMVRDCAATRYSYAIDTEADFRTQVLSHSFEGLRLAINSYEIESKLVGLFNAYNLTASFATALLLGEERESVKRALSEIRSPKGRFDLYKAKSGRCAIVDYAHSPDALDAVLSTLNTLKREDQRIITILGCGGERDREKRPKMAKVALAWSDLLIVTTDNPRGEDPEAIADEMMSGLSADSLVKVERILDRKAAIDRAAALSSADDLILVAGRGHETTQEIANVQYPFDDLEEVKRSLL